MDVIVPVPIPDKTLEVEDDDITSHSASTLPFLPLDSTAPGGLVEEGDEDDDFPSLSAATLLALQEFRTEQSALAEHFESLRASHSQSNAPSAPPIPDSSLPHQPQSHPASTPSNQIDIHTIPENWALSQFWYSAPTAHTFARALLAHSTPRTHIACVCAPSVFIALKNILASPPYVNGPASKPGICLLEYDRRFEVLCDGERAGIGAGAGAGVGEGEREFVHYDFEYALRLPGWLAGWADRVVVDPPFLSDQCQAAVAETVGWLLKSKTEAGDRPSKTEAEQERGEDMEAPKIIVCTGAIMADLVLELYSDAGGVQMRRTGFEAVHEGGRLSNEWGTVANFEGEEWRFVD